MLPIRTTLALAALLAAGCAAQPYPRVASSDEALGQVHAGMTKDEVRRTLGTPQETMRFPLSGNEAWTYVGHDTWGYYTEYSVTFTPAGQVASTIARRVNDGGDHR